MAKRVKMPSAKEVGKIVGGLIGKEPIITKTKVPLRAGPGSPLITAEYVTSEGELAVLLQADLPFACRSGAALALIPAPEADAGIANPSDDGEIMENYREIANVLTAAFCESDTRLILREMYGVKAELPKALRLISKKPRLRVDMDVEIPGYGKGKLALLSAA